MGDLGLAAYVTSSGSDSDNDETVRVAPQQVNAAPIVPTENPAPAPLPHASSPRPLARTHEAVQQPAFQDFGKRATQYKRTRDGLPLFRTAAADDSDVSDDELRPKHAGRQARPGGDGILNFLPKPRNAPRSFTPKLVETTPRASPTTPHAVPPSTAAPRPETAELYRLPDDAATSSLAVETPASALGTSVAPAYAQSGANTRPAAEEALLQTLKAAGKNVTFKEVSADTLHAVDPGKRAEFDAVRQALGSDYAKQLQAATAGKFEPSRMQRQKHQLNALYHHAKVTELQDMERKSQGNKSKAETAAKYGW